MMMVTNETISWRRLGHVARGVLAAIGLIPFGYFCLGLALGAIPRATAPSPAAGADAITIFVESSAVHTAIIVPKQAAGVDWRDWARPQDLRDPRYAGFPFLAIGWGEAGFFRETPRWRDVKPGTILHAAFGSDRTLIHVDHLPLPRANGDDVRMIRLSPQAYRRLVTFIQASWRRGGPHYPGYDVYDAFYEANGRYSAAHTCNNWTGDALAAAGVRTGWWTPFPWTVTWWL
ncbi:TIGR02117 family protein [Sphingomonas sanguinis]|uniref:TIGR02117 family protein n=1 Tax=Sphingomonas sanguinis TaxID=33051 RepID=UPI001C567D59|nr:TIGR02117 family protein [Sphingomonas sanguinis]QXT37188.1 TIGR02117 family protein [Sphingomonas sanguinis]